MALLEDLTLGARVTRAVAGQAVTVVAVQWHGTAALTLTFRDYAHSLPAHYSGNEVRDAKRYKLGKRLGEVSRLDHSPYASASRNVRNRCSASDGTEYLLACSAA
jgi:hypothetical protein